MTSGEPSRHTEGAQGGGTAPGLPAQYLRPERLDRPDLAILVIDDDRADRKLVRRLISAFSAEATVSEADSMDLAPDIDAAEFDGIFLDNMLPGRTGVECLSALRARWPRAAIFLMTSHGDEILAKTAILSIRNCICVSPKFSRELLVEGDIEEIAQDLQTFRGVCGQEPLEPPLRQEHDLPELVWTIAKHIFNRLTDCVDFLFRDYLATLCVSACKFDP